MSPFHSPRLTPGLVAVTGTGTATANGLWAPSCAGSEGRMGITPHPWGTQSPQEPFSPIVAYLDIFTTPLPPSVLSLSDSGALTGNWQHLPGFQGAGSLSCAPFSWHSEVAVLLPSDALREH